MQAPNPPTFHPTVWPAAPPPVPPVWVSAPLVPIERGICASPHLPGGSIPTELPPDFVLREVLATVDASEGELVDFANRWGPPTGYGGARAFEYFPAEETTDHVAAINEAAARLDRDDLVSIAGIDMGLRVLRSLVRHLLAHLEGKGDEAVIAAWTDEGHVIPDVGFAWFVWDVYVNRGLAKFTVHVRTENPAYRDHSEWVRPSPLLFDACCLQLVHYLTGGAQVHRCANERCRRPFTRQRGNAREDYSQYRSRGVRYCSPLCAKAQSERDRRRRRSQERAGQ